MKKMYGKKVNETDTLLVYADYQTPKMKFHIWNLSKQDLGL